jgi:hypothetical protein
VHIPNVDIDAAGRRCLLHIDRRRGWSRCWRLMQPHRYRALQRCGLVRDPDRDESSLGFRLMLPYLTAPTPQQTPVHAVPERDIRNPRARLKALGKDPGLLLPRPAPSPRLSGDQLYPPIPAPLMTVIKTRICHRDISAPSSKCAEFRFFARVTTGGILASVTFYPLAGCGNSASQIGIDTTQMARMN